MTFVSRTAASTKRYADAACEVGKKLGVPVVHLWTAFMTKARFQAEGWKTGDPIPGSMNVLQNDELVKLMHDGVWYLRLRYRGYAHTDSGLHFTPAGYDVLFDEVTKVIANNWPDQLPESLPMVLPAWNDTAGWETWTASQSSV
jgi:lysophospholipase L1-like esterase